jgi:hypothetical protein
MRRSTMDPNKHSFRQVMWGAVLSVTLAFVGAMTANVAADNGGFFCGYGDCEFHYAGCDWANHTDQGNGECEVTVSQNAGCSVSYWCTGEQFQWHAYSTESSWRVKDELECCR